MIERSFGHQFSARVLAHIDALDEFQQSLNTEVNNSTEKSVQYHREGLERIRQDGQEIVKEFRSRLLEAQEEILQLGQQKADAISTQIEKALQDSTHMRDEVLGKLSEQVEARASTFEAKLAEAKKAKKMKRR